MCSTDLWIREKKAKMFFQHGEFDPSPRDLIQNEPAQADQTSPTEN